jgi:hypothetical protein
MSTEAVPVRDWFKSSRSANNANCVEVRFAGAAVLSLRERCSGP